MPRLHKREKPVKEAELALRERLLNWEKDWIEKLTTAEYLSVLVRVLSETLQSILKYAIRQERHGNTNKPGGLE